VRQGAVNALKNEKVLAQVLSQRKPYYRGEFEAELLYRVISKIKDQEALKQMVWSAYEHAPRIFAAKALQDQSMLADIVMKHPETDVQEAAVRRLTDPSILSTVALSHPSLEVRGWALRGVTDQAVLTRIALQDTDPTMRSGAAHRVTDQDLLRRFARDPSANMRKAAVSNLTDEQELQRLVENDEREIALAAVVRVKNQELLLKWAKSHPEGLVRWEAIQRVDAADRDSLILSALSDTRSTTAAEKMVKGSSPEVRRAASASASFVARVEALQTMREMSEALPKDQLMRMAFEDEAPSVRLEALQSMNDPEANDRAARDDASARVREFAATRFSGGHPVRLRTILNDPDAALRERLASVIQDPDLAKELVLRSSDPVVRRIGVRRLTDKDMLKALSKSEGDQALRKTAEERLKALEKK